MLRKTSILLKKLSMKLRENCQILKRDSIMPNGREMKIPTPTKNGKRLMNSSKALKLKRRQWKQEETLLKRLSMLWNQIWRISDKSLLMLNRLERILLKKSLMSPVPKSKNTNQKTVHQHCQKRKTHPAPLVTTNPPMIKEALVKTKDKAHQAKVKVVHLNEQYESASKLNTLLS
jgi:hypothetical protein